LPTDYWFYLDNQIIITVNQELNDGRKYKRAGALGNSMNAGVAGSYLLFNGFKFHYKRAALRALER